MKYIAAVVFSVFAQVMCSFAYADFYTGLEAYQRGDHAEALKNWKSLAIQGNASAQYDLGLVYLSGQQDVPKDPVKASYWFRKSAKQKLPRAMSMLGSLYEQGLGVAKNYEEAAYWYRNAAEQDDPLGQYRLGILYKNGKGVGRDLSKAHNWLLYASERGLAPAQYNLAIMYYKGIGVPRNFQKALRWHGRAAGQGDVNALITLGVMHFKGEGVERNLKEAYSWWDAAVAAGDESSIRTRDAVAAMMSEEELKLAKSLAEEKKERLAEIKKSVDLH